MAAWRWRPAPYGGHRDLSDRLIFLRQTTRMVREHIRAARLEAQGPAVGQGAVQRGLTFPQHPLADGAATTLSAIAVVLINWRMA